MNATDPLRQICRELEVCFSESSGLSPWFRNSVWEPGSVETILTLRPLRRQRYQVEISARPLGIVIGEVAPVFAAAVIDSIGAGAPDDTLSGGRAVLVWRAQFFRRDAVTEWLTAVGIGGKSRRNVFRNQVLQVLRRLAFVKPIESQGNRQARRIHATPRAGGRLAQTRGGAKQALIGEPRRID